LILASCAAVLTIHAEKQAFSADSSNRPNIVLIVADDLGWGEIGCYGQEKIPTPNIDSLARDGMRFTQFYSGAPVCAPSRCVLMTGKHLGHAEVRGNLSAPKVLPQFDEGQYPLSAAAVTFPQLLQTAGYATAAMGKWGLGPVGSTGEPNKKGFDLFFGYNCQGVAHSYYPEYLWRNSEHVLINAKPIPGHAKQSAGEVRMNDWIGKAYAPHLMIAEAEKFLADHAGGPFFLYLPFIEPHVSLHPPQELVEKFPAEWDKQAYRGLNGYLPHPRPRAAYAAMIHELDSYVGRTLAALKKAGVAERTLVIFTSDNGATHAGRLDPNFHIGGADPKFFNSTADLRGYKGSVYEGGIRVPLIARYPGHIAKAAVSDQPGYFADIFPTLCDAANVGKPDGLDGNSLWPVMTGQEKSLASRKPMIWVFPEYGGQVAVRLGDLKFVRQSLKTKKPGPWEVYNLASDRGEKHDIAAEHPQQIAAVEKLLRREVADNPVFPLTIPGVNDAIP
jgi:arylsulfatase A-like enzyme